MLNLGLGRVSSKLALIVACSLLGGCDNGGKPQSDAKANVPDSPAVTVQATPASVVFQLTGLVLIVPPKQRGDSLRILLPDTTGHGPHAALLGFPIANGIAIPDNFCMDDALGRQARNASICYVNLDVWTLQAFGSGGRPETPTTQQLSVADPGLLNVTNASGRKHRVHFPQVDSVIRSRFVFLAGAPGTKPCRLATWTFVPANENGAPTGAVTRPLTNVLDWEITDLNSPALVFAKRTGESVTIELPAPETRILIAHIPEAERAHLPPNTVAEITDTETTASHFHAYYDALRAPNTDEEKIPANSERRAIPRRGAGRQSPCPVEIRTSENLVPAFASVATYACMPALGEGGS